MEKNIIYDLESRERLKYGIDQIANAVKITLGPSGKNVIISSDRSVPPIITKDGVTVAKSIELEDHFANIGAQMMKEVSIETQAEVGDGTTTAMVIAQSILNHGFKKLENGSTVTDVVEELRSGLPFILQALQSISKPIETNDDIHHVALISTNNDTLLSQLITDCYEKVGDNIIYEQSKTPFTYCEISKGMRFISTYISTHFINEPSTNSVVFKEGILFIYNGKIKNIKQISPVLYQAEKYKQPLIIIAEGIDDNSLINLLGENKRGTLPCAVIQSPGFGYGREKTLQDISIYTGAKIYEESSNLKLPIEFGKFDGVTIGEKVTVLQGMYGDKNLIEDRIKELELSKREKNPYEITQINERIAKFKNGIGVIYIGANSPLELKEREDRLDDAINAVKAATQEGIIPGGGITLYDISEGFPSGSIYNSALKSPYLQIISNQYDKKERYTFEECYRYGIIDPVKVTSTALKNAVSVASTILTTECIILQYI